MSLLQSERDRIIFEVAGQQHIASVNDKIAIQYIPGVEEGAFIKADRILAFLSQKSNIFSAEVLANKNVTLEVIKYFLGDKKISFKKFPRNNSSARKKGMRARHFIVKVISFQ
jgi:ribosomal protein L21